MSAPEAPSDAKPGRSGRLLTLVHALIAYGRQVAARLRGDNPTLAPSDIALILSRIARGLLRAEALEARIVRDALQLDAEPAPRRAASRGQSRPTRPAAKPTGPTDPLLSALPTAEQIAAEMRHRPIGAVIADICRDIGIMPSHPLWPEIRALITSYRGNLANLVKDTLDRLFQHNPALAWPHSPLPEPVPTSRALSATGPP